jgi:hypothetical protein
VLFKLLICFFVIFQVPFPFQQSNGCSVASAATIATIAPNAQYAFPPGTYDLAIMGPHGNPYITATQEYTKYPTVPVDPTHPIYEPNDSNFSDDEESSSSSNESGASRHDLRAENSADSDSPPAYDQIAAPATRVWYTTSIVNEINNTTRAYHPQALSQVNT